LSENFPGFQISPLTLLPDWGGWNGVVYDPMLKFAIYPHTVGTTDQTYTYALWDLTKQKLVASLENIFTNFPARNFYPMPRWSPDGSHFVFVGGVFPLDPSSDIYKLELYQVDRGGQAEQLTHLSGDVYIWDSSLSWSPDGRYIAFFIGPPLGAATQKAQVAVLDTVTLDVTKYCISISFHGFDGGVYGTGFPPPPIWSPDSKQFLVEDWYQKEHRHTILVDIVHGSAAQLADDMEPMAWLSNLDR
jgi:dipeptidyl aminopeptidase/acylaminoacyl peptidase